MYNIAICDDELKICETYQKTIEKIFAEIEEDASVKVYIDSLNFFENINNIQIDILLLDIDMPQINGMEIAQKIQDLQKDTIFMFVTNQDTLVYESFRYQPFQFIRKSVFDSEIKVTLMRAIEEIYKRRQHYVVQVGNEVTKVLFSDILYFEADGNYLVLFTNHGEFRIRNTLQAVGNELKHNGFVRIHKGFLLNQKAVHRLLSDQIQLSNNMFLPIGRANRQTVRKLLMEYMMR